MIRIKEKITNGDVIAELRRFSTWKVMEVRLKVVEIVDGEKREKEQVVEVEI